MKKRKVFVSILLILLGLIVISGTIYLYLNKNNKSDIYAIETLAVSAATSSISEINTTGVPVLLYHAISPDVIKGSYGVMPLSLFVEQLNYIKEEGYVTITLNDLYEYMTEAKSIPIKSIVISFDDTNESDYGIAFPELKKRGFSGVFFTIGSKANTPLWRTRLQEMKSSGMEIASHTMNHKYSGGNVDTKGERIEVDNEQTITYELNQSKKIIEEIAGSQVNYLAWPGDSYTENMINLAQTEGYKGIFIAKTAHTNNIMKHPVGESGLNKIGDDVLYIKRITMHGAASMDDFKLMLEDGIYPRSR